ncbi:FIP1[V]-like protein isoform X1 [Hibiscus syriacus]|uniref:FIP1[V]-like protein isoform X1 n=1 Tax=Hibiscus syriacus TaxID=106335 RepID=UPI0019207962|nr:FIP1[V]-like protein isoform X1 [Hibiscus syriacus]
MEDDDEFGDLYTDVLMPFSSSTAPPPSHPPPIPHLHLPIDSNHQSRDGDNTLLGAPVSIPDAQTLASFKFHPPAAPAASLGSIPNRDDSAPEPMVLDSKQEPADGNDVVFDIEEGGSNAIEGSGLDDPIIPCLTESVRQGDSGRDNDGNDNGIEGGGQVEPEGEGDDWDSDSEDDLQIVLNDNNHGHMAMERGGMMGEDDDDDEDGDPLVIVADGDANQGIEEHDWGEGGGQGADGEGKEGADGEGKVGTAGISGGSVVVPKIGYSSHGFHPFHSQFKYVRPGAAPMPGATAGGPGGAPAQVRPVMGAMVGRGRGDWRPPGLKAGLPMQKGFHPSFGMPGWGNNTGRGFGGGLDFTLPSHKTIFEVDIDSFEEKPWKYPGVDLSDFFNFGLNEETWKDYCKQLEQRRLETTMQSKIRVYESGRTEQDYDPDLPPELAAATGQEIPADAANFAKPNGVQNDFTKGTVRIRPPIPTGRAIQVEGGSGERLPSIDTRPPRMRDSDAIIEIVCQDTLDDDSYTGNTVEDQIENDLQREDIRGDLASETNIVHEETEYVNGFPNAYSSRKREPVRSSVPEDDGILPISAEASRPYGPGSRSQSPTYHNVNFGSPNDERHRQGRARKRSPHTTPIRGKQDKFSDTHSDEEESVDSMDRKCPHLVRDAREISVERKGDVDDELELAGRSPDREKDVLMNDTHNDENPLDEKLSSLVHRRKLQEYEDGEDSMAARINENSEARSGSSRDYQKWRDGADDEVVQGGRSSQIAIAKKNLDEHDQNFLRKDSDARREIERSQIVGKPREGSYPPRDFDAGSSHNLHIKMEGFDRRRESGIPNVARQQREDDFHGRKSRTEDLRKRERDNEMSYRNRAKVRESERSDKEDYPPSRKQLDNGIYDAHHDKDASPRHRERSDNGKSRYETADDYDSKRRKDEEYLRRGNADKEAILHGNRESSSSRRKRERDEILEPCKRAEQQRIRDNFDHQSSRDKDEVHRERVEKQRERDEWLRPKQSHDECLSKREREEGRGTARSGHSSEDKAWVGRSRTKDEHKVSEKEYQLKETVRQNEHMKRRDRNGDESFSRHRGREDSYARGHQFTNDERKSRQERKSTRSEHPVNASDSQRGHEKRHKENTRKGRESEGGDQISLGSAKRNQEGLSGHYAETGLKSDEKNENPVHYNPSRKHREDASLNDQQKELKRGRSKLERWTSHKERDFSINSKSSTSSKIKEIGENNNIEASESNTTPDEPVENHSSDNKNVGEPETKDADTRPSEERHLDTVEKLKKRSERFKLPMPKEKDAVAIKMESEPLPSAKNETPAESEVKLERPARKRRWISK